MFRKKPPLLSVSEELEQLYNYACENTVSNLALEQAGNVESALKGWKSLHTLLLYKTDIYERLQTKLSDKNLSILQQLRQLRDENVKHLIRSQMRVDELSRRSLAEPGILPHKFLSKQSSLATSTSRKNGPAKPLQLSMRLGLHQPTASNSLRSMRKSLRPGISPITTLKRSNSSRDALGAANLAVHSMENLPRFVPRSSTSSERTLSFPPVHQSPLNNPFHDFDDVIAENNWQTTRLTSQRLSIEEVDLIDLDDTSDFLDLYNSPNPSPRTTNIDKFDELSIKPTPPSPPQPRHSALHNSSSSKPSLYKTQVTRPKPAPQLEPSGGLLFTAPVKTPYVYKKPTPINVQSLMKNAAQQKARPKTSRALSSTEQKKPISRPNPTVNPTVKANPRPKPVTSMSYNYVRAPPKKVGAAAVARKSTPDPTPAGPLKADTNASHVSEEEEELISLIRGIDPIAARQILSDIVIKGDEVHWDDVVGLEAAKNGLKEAVVYPFLRPDLFKGLREPARGMLLFGPPGTGKTMLARAVATESKSTFFSISSSSLTSKYLGESEKLVKALFLLARKLSPLIVFIDEIDSLMSSRSDGEQESTRRIKNEFLVQWSELLSAAAGKDTPGEDVLRVLILGATNLPWSIDEAARRRFMRRQYIPLPEPETRRAQLLRLLHYQNHTLTDQDLDTLMELTDGFSGSDVTALAKDSAMGPLRLLGDKLLLTPTENIRAINLDDFKKSLAYIRPSVSQEGISEYEKWAEKFGSSGA